MKIERVNELGNEVREESFDEMNPYNTTFENDYTRAKILKKAEKSFKKSCVPEIKNSKHAKMHDASSSMLTYRAEINQKRNRFFACQTDEFLANIQYDIVGNVQELQSFPCMIYNLIGLWNPMIFREPFMYEKRMALQEIIRVISRKGYRQWYFSKEPNELFRSSKVNIKDIKEHFIDNEKVQNCTNFEEITKNLGKVKQKNFSPEFLDEFIAFIAKETIPYEETRIFEFGKIEDNIKREIPVPVRVNDLLYYWDTEKVKKANSYHYAIIVGLHSGKFVMLDSCEKNLLLIPMSQLFKALTKENVTVWDVERMWNLKK